MLFYEHKKYHNKEEKLEIQVIKEVSDIPEIFESAYVKDIIKIKYDSKQQLIKVIYGLNDFIEITGDDDLLLKSVYLELIKLFKKIKKEN